MKKRLVISLLLLMFSFAVTGCKAKKEPAADEETSDAKQSKKTGDTVPQKKEGGSAKAPKQPVSANENKLVLVTVDGREITESQLQQRLEQERTKVHTQMPEAFKEQYEKGLREKLLNEMVMETLLLQKVMEKKVVVSSRELEQCIQRQCRLQKIDQKDLLEMLQTKGQSFDEYKEQVRKEISFEKLIEMELANRADITEDEMKNYYLSHSDKFELSKKVEIDRIYLKVPPDATKQAKTDIRNVADELLERIRSGQDFNAVAREHSDAPSAARGGREGLFKKGQMRPELEEVAFSLAVNQVSDVIEAQAGYHILKVTGVQEARKQPYEEVKEEIRSVLSSQKIKEQVGPYLETLKAKATIIYK